MLIEFVFYYILLIMLLQLYRFFPLGFLPPRASYTLRQSPHPCSCPWVTQVSSLAAPFPILDFSSPWLFCNYLFVLLNPLNSSPIPPHAPPNWQPSNPLCIHDSVSVHLVCLVFLDSIVDGFVFFTFYCS